MDTSSPQKADGEGFEQSSNSCGKRSIGLPSDAESDALFTDSDTTDPDLAAIIDRWGDLPAAVKAGILAMVREQAD